MIQATQMDYFYKNCVLFCRLRRCLRPGIKLNLRALDWKHWKHIRFVLCAIQRGICSLQHDSKFYFLQNHHYWLLKLQKSKNIAQFHYSQGYFWIALYHFWFSWRILQNNEYRSTLSHHTWCIIPWTSFLSWCHFPLFYKFDQAHSKALTMKYSIVLRKIS